MDRLWARSADVLVERFSDGTVLLSPSSGALHHLDAPAAIVWELLRVPTAEHAITGAVVDRTGADPNVVGADVAQLLDALDALGLVSWTPA